MCCWASAGHLLRLCCSSAAALLRLCCVPQQRLALRVAAPPGGLPPPRRRPRRPPTCPQSNANLVCHAGRLTRDFKVVLIEDLVKSGNALWFDKAQRAALVLWRTVPEWAAAIHAWARAQGFEDSVVTVEEMQVGGGVVFGRVEACLLSLWVAVLRGSAGSAVPHAMPPPLLLPSSPHEPTHPQTHALPACLPVRQEGVYVAGTELEGLHREVIVRAVRHLETQARPAGGCRLWAACTCSRPLLPCPPMASDWLGAPAACALIYS